MNGLIQHKKRADSSVERNSRVEMVDESKSLLPPSGTASQSRYALVSVNQILYLGATCVGFAALALSVLQPWFSVPVKPLRTMIALTAIVVAFVLIVGYALARYQETAHQPLRTTPQPAGWIRAAGDPSHAGYFRKRFDLPGEVRHAWIKIAATDAFEISVNRNPLGRVFLWRPTRPFQNGSSEKGQVLLPQESAMAMNFPREYQGDGHDSWLLPTYLDLSDAFTQGKNVITIELESRLAPARVALTGEIVLWTGEVIPIGSDETWIWITAIGSSDEGLRWIRPASRNCLIQTKLVHHLSARALSRHAR